MTHRSTSITTVQRWVLSTLAGTTIMHLSAGLVVAAAFLDTAGKQVAMLVIATAFGLAAMVAALVIHGSRLLSPLLLVGFLPALVGSWFIFWR